VEPVTDFNAPGETPPDNVVWARRLRAFRRDSLIRSLNSLHALTSRRMNTPTLRSEHQGLQLLWADVLTDWQRLEVHPADDSTRPEWDLWSKSSTRATTRPERWRRSVMGNVEWTCAYALCGACDYEFVKATLYEIDWGYIELTSDIAGWAG
jgi:hypothetical protein